MSDLMFCAAICTDVGRVRKNNEDNFNMLGVVLQEKDYYGHFTEKTDYVREGVLGVFDGMGGESNGEMASLEAAKSVEKYKDSLLTLTPEAMHDFSLAANSAVRARADQMDADMGTTLAVVAIKDGRLTSGNVGDTRIYHLRGNQLTQLSEDHTVSAMMVKERLMTEAEAKADRRRHQLTQHLGISPDILEIKAFTQTNLTLQEGDRILLCSDGVTDALSDSDLSILLSQDTSCEKMAGGIVESAMRAGSRDNVTALVIKVGFSAPSSSGQNDKSILDATFVGPARTIPEDSTARRLWTLIWIVGCLQSVVIGGALALLIDRLFG